MENRSHHQSRRFVVLFHEFPIGHNRANHWDLMLEQGGRLLTWALPEMPAIGKSIAARRLPDHRLEYLNYEGPVSGDRGEVSRLIAGTYAWQPGAELEIARMDFDAGQWEIRLAPVGPSIVKISFSDV